MRPDWADLPDEPTRPPARRGWAEKFGDAWRGLKLGVRGQASFAVHFFFATLAILTGLLLECDRVDWCLVALCIGLVLTAELFNSALEALFHGLDGETKARLVGVLDIAAGAVLVASVTAATVGVVVFAHRLLVFTGVIAE